MVHWTQPQILSSFYTGIFLRCYTGGPNPVDRPFACIINPLSLNLLFGNNVDMISKVRKVWNPFPRVIRQRSKWSCARISLVWRMEQGGPAVPTLLLRRTTPTSQHRALSGVSYCFKDFAKVIRSENVAMRHFFRFHFMRGSFSHSILTLDTSDIPQKNTVFGIKEIQANSAHLISKVSVILKFVSYKIRHLEKWSLYGHG